MRIMILLLWVLLGPAMMAQGELRYGVKFGINFSSIAGEPEYYSEPPFESRTDFHAGAFMEVPLKKKFLVQPEILYSSKGGVIRYDSTDSMKTFKLNYIDVALLVKYYVMTSLSFECGPSLGFLLSATTEFSSTNTQSDRTDYYSHTDVGIGLGATYRLPIGVLFSIRYNKGLSNLNDTPGFDNQNQNNVFQVSTGYSF